MFQTLTAISELYTGVRRLGSAAASSSLNYLQHWKRQDGGTRKGPGVVLFRLLLGCVHLFRR
jgi:hypothetical protein